MKRSWQRWRGLLWSWVRDGRGWQARRGRAAGPFSARRGPLAAQGVARWPFVCIWDNHELSWKGLAEPGELRQRGGPGADAQGGGEPGLVRVPAGAGGEGAESRRRRRCSARPRRPGSSRRRGEKPWSADKARTTRPRGSAAARTSSAVSSRPSSRSSHRRASSSSSDSLPNAWETVSCAEKERARRSGTLRRPKARPGSAAKTPNMPDRSLSPPPDTTPNAASTSQAGAPFPTLPKGGGAIRGIGEKLGANPITGTGSLSVPIATSPGRSGFAPQLALAYDSSAGNGPFGLGWHLSVPGELSTPQQILALSSRTKLCIRGCSGLQDGGGPQFRRRPFSLGRGNRIWLGSSRAREAPDRRSWA